MAARASMRHRAAVRIAAALTGAATSVALTIAFAFAAALLLAGCTSPRPAAESGAVTFLIESMPTNLDPRIGTDAFSAHLDGMIFSSLLAHDAQMNIVPDLAQTWDTPDPLTYIFHLRRGVAFHDGRPLTSADVKFTFDSIMSGAIKTPKRASFRTVAAIDAPDDATIIFHLKEPYASFLWNLCRPGVGIVPAGSGLEIAQHPIGTGPFRFVSMKTDEEIILERNANYFGDSAASPNVHAAALASVAPQPASASALTAAAAPTNPIERIRFRIVPEATVRALELRKGTADGEINSLTPDMVRALSAQPGLQVSEQPGTVLAYIAINFDDPILAHREVRQALAYATDRDALIAYLLRGEARPAASLLPPNHWAYDPNVRQYGHDNVRANQLLDAAGFPRGAGGVRFHLTIKTSTEESARLLSEALADQWKQIGVVLDLRPLEFATFYSDITHGSFQLYTYRWIGGNNDPDIFEFVFSSKKSPPDGANRGHYRNPQLDALIDQERIEMNQASRKEILSTIQKIVADDEPYINLWYLDNECVHRDRLTDVLLPPGGDYEFLARATLR
jgi:peptide/nickel transport system substrate-binding protein